MRISDWSSDVCSSDLAQPALKRDRALVGRWAQALLAAGTAIITDMPDSDAGLTETVRLLGPVRPTFFGEYFDVRVHVDPVTLAYTAKALAMHTDVPAEQLAPGVQFLNCRPKSVAGGAQERKHGGRGPGGEA